MTIQQNRDISFMIWLRTGFHGDDKQAKNNKESISERFVQATKRRKRNRPTRKEQKKEKKEKRKKLQEEKRRGKNKNNPATEKEEERKKVTVSKILVQNTSISLSINIWVRKKGFKLIIMVKALVLMTRTFLEG